MARQLRFINNSTAVVVILVSCLAARITGSAIPMWEFLTKDEKINHLSKIFTKQATRYCSDSSSPDCMKNVLIVGKRNLANMDENDLDLMDPYQRNANDIIWRGIVRNTRLPIKYEHKNSYYMAEDDPLVTGEKDHNGIGEESAPTNDYVRPSDHGGSSLVGPMVIRVFPDGSPVPEDAERPLPRDEDIEDTKYSVIPFVPEIEAKDRRFFYNRPSYDSLAGSNKLNIYVAEKLSIRPDLISTVKNSQNLRYNPLFRDHRVSEISKNSRTIRFY